MLAGAHATHALAVHLSLLKGLQMGNLQSVQTLVTEHLRLKKNLSLRELEKRVLTRVLKVANGTDGLVHRLAGTVARLERRSVCSLVHVEVAHVLGLAFLSLLPDIGLPPVAFEVARRASTMPVTAATLNVRLASLTAMVGVIGGLMGKLGVSAASTGCAASAAADSHALAATMTATATPACRMLIFGGGGACMTAGTGITLMGRRARVASSRQRELKPGRLALLLCELGSLLRLGKCERMTTSVARATVATTSPTRIDVLSALGVSLLAREVAEARCARRWGGRRAHSDVG